MIYSILSKNSRFCFVFLNLFLAACVTRTPIASQAVTPAIDTILPSVVYTPASTPTVTPMPGLVILVASPEADPSQVGEIQAVLYELSAQSGLRFETRPGLAEADLVAELRLAVVLPPDPGLATLVPAHPTVQFLALGIPGLQPAQNLTLLGAQGERPDQQGFLAGYLAAVTTQDWRVGVISRGDTPAGRAARNAFSNGVIFYCGLCRPVYPPFYEYPLFADLPAGASQAEQQAAADVLIDSAVATVYVFPGAGDTFLLEYLAQAGVNLIGGIAPPAGLETRWVATLRLDLPGPLRQVWPALIAGQGGATLELPLLLIDRNESLLSIGRQRLVDQALSDLLAGYIDTGVDPLTGELR